MSLGEYVKELRKEKGLTQAKLAELLEITQGYVNKIESNSKNPSPTIIKKLSELLDVDYTEMMEKACYIEGFSELKQENTRLREALGFYANEEKWSEWDEPSEFECLPPEAIADSGRIARIALGVSK